MNIEIKHRDDVRVLWSGDYAIIKDALVAAAKACADLSGSNLSGSDLSGSNLSGSDLGDAKIVGENAVVQIGPIGSRSDHLVAFRTDGGMRLRTGCFYGGADDFLARVLDTHGTNAHATNYRNAVELAASMLGVDK